MKDVLLASFFTICFNYLICSAKWYFRLVGACLTVVATSYRWSLEVFAVSLCCFHVVFSASLTCLSRIRTISTMLFHVCLNPFSESTLFFDILRNPVKTRYTWLVWRLETFTAFWLSSVCGIEMGQRTPCPYPCLIWDHNESTYFICFHIFSDWNQIQTHSVTLHLTSFHCLHIIRTHHWRHLTEMAQSLRSRAVLRAAKVRHGHSFSASQVPSWNRWLLEDCIKAITGRYFMVG